MRKRKNWTFEEVKIFFEERGCELLSTENDFNKITDPLDYICKCKSKKRLSFHKFRYQKHGCKNCSGMEKYTIKQIKEIFEKEDCKLLSTEYVNNSFPLSFICSCGRIGETTISRFNSGVRCSECSKEKKAAIRRKNIIEIEECYKEQGCELLSVISDGGYYKNPSSIIKFKCHCGEIGTKTFALFKKTPNCQECNKKGNGKSNKEFMLNLLKIIQLAKKQGGIPTKRDIENMGFYLNSKYMKQGFNSLGFKNYYEYLEAKGFGKIDFTLKRRLERRFLTEREIIDIMKNYKKKYGKYPMSEEFNRNKDLPTYNYVLDSLRDIGEDFKSFTLRNNLRNNRIYENTIFHPKDYWFYIDKLKRISDLSKGERIPSKRFKSLGLPYLEWYIANHPKKSISSMDDLWDSIGNVSSLTKNKELIKRYIMSIYKKEGVIFYDDFRGDKYKIGIGCIKRVFGSFNKMLIELGIPVNQEDMVNRQKTVEELQLDIEILCKKIREEQGRDVISRSDIDECDQCLSAGTYDKIFKEKLKISLSDFINKLGYQTNTSGSGTNYTFNDMEKTLSKYEFLTSLFLREEMGMSYSKDYIRSEKYKKFIKGYKGNMDCDYLINDLYIEVAGFLVGYENHYRNNVVIEDSKKENYRLKLKEKENMLRINSKNFLFLFPSDFNDDTYKLKIKKAILNDKVFLQQAN